MQHLLPMQSSARAFAASVALHCAGITAALLWIGPGLVPARWAAAKQVPFRSTILDEAQQGPLTSPPLPAPAVETEDPAETVPLPDPAVCAEPVPPPPPIPDHTPRPRIRDPLTHADWRTNLRPRPTAVLGETAPPPEPESAPAQAAVPPSPLVGHNQPPQYPWVAWRRGIEGTVIVELTVAADGRVELASIAESSGNALLDEAALQALRAWRFDAAPTGTGSRVHRRPVIFRLTDH